MRQTWDHLKNLSNSVLVAGVLRCRCTDEEEAEDTCTIVCGSNNRFRSLTSSEPPLKNGVNRGAMCVFLGVACALAAVGALILLDVAKDEVRAEKVVMRKKDRREAPRTRARAPPGTRLRVLQAPSMAGTSPRSRAKHARLQPRCAAGEPPSRKPTQQTRPTTPRRPPSRRNRAPRRQTAAPRRVTREAVTRLTSARIRRRTLHLRRSPAPT
ncbi:uncharacterized protein LOC144136472 isoform X2 [Amblyomma americanum]